MFAGVANDGGADVSDEVAVAEVGPRLRSLRQGRGLSLAELSQRTGISISTLSRLETGARVPGLEHLVALARAYAVSLDDLVGVRFSRDPRLQFETVEEHGRIIMPLAAIAGGLQVEHAIIRAPERGVPEPVVHVHGPDEEERSADFEPDSMRTHRGYVWMLVLEGAVRLVVGSHDLVLNPGEAAEFDTRVPHWIGPARSGPAHVLNVHGRDGQRIRVRARPV